MGMGSQFPRGWGVASQGFFPGCPSRIGRLLINNTFSVELNISYLAVKAACKRTQQLPTLLRQQYWELLRLSAQTDKDVFEMPVVYLLRP